MRHLHAGALLLDDPCVSISVEKPPHAPLHHAITVAVYCIVSISVEKPPHAPPIPVHISLDHLNSFNLSREAASCATSPSTTACASFAGFNLSREAASCATSWDIL